MTQPQPATTPPHATELATTPPAEHVPTPTEPELPVPPLVAVLALPCHHHDAGPGEPCRSSPLGVCVDRIRRARYGRYPGPIKHPFHVPGHAPSEGQATEPEGAGQEQEAGTLAARAAAIRAARRHIEEARR